MMKDIDRISEKIERAALESLHHCCPVDVRSSLGLELVEVEDGVAACCVEDSSILINRAVGLGSQSQVSEQSIRDITAVYESRGIANYFLHIYSDTLSEPAQKLLQTSAYVKKRGWMKFSSDNPQLRNAGTSLRVEQIGLDKSEDFGRIVCGAFGMSGKSIPVLSGLANDDRWKLFVTYDGAQAAGAGALFVDGDSGWFEWGATDPGFRRRGSQAAIMAARLTLASELNCRYIFTETGEAVEGDPQHSYKNILKAGFKESVLRENYAPSES